MNVNKILVPIDSSDHSTLALQWGISLAQKYGAQLLLLHVIPKAAEEVSIQRPGAYLPTYPPVEGTTLPSFSYEEEVRQALDARSRPSPPETVLIDYVEKTETELADLVRTHLTDPGSATVKVTVGKPAEEILQVARDEAVDLIVMGTHGRTGLRHVLLGSIAETVVRTAPCPVFTVKATGHGAS
jgi:nucleotide-binding universal stress UspA family protein